MTRIAQPHTLKLKGHIKKSNVMFLIDTRSTHSFVDTNTAKRLNLFVYSMPNMRFMVEDSKKIEGMGKFQKVELQIQDYNLESQFYIVPLGGVDIVLGVQRIQTLGTYSTNHKKKLYIVHMGRGKIQIIWFSTTSKSSGVLPPNGEANS
jgi:hypothetical protein